MDPFWGWMAVAVALSFAIVLLAVRLLVVQQTKIRFFVVFAIVSALLLISILKMVATVGHARDLDGRYAASPLKSWFDSLRSGKGPCCSDADGYALSDVDWVASGGRYRVRIPRDRFDPSAAQPTPPDGIEMIWIDVEGEAVITEPNRSGRTMVWPIWGHQGPTVRCFMPGSMT